MLTAKGRDVERDKGLALGADAYVTKPFSTRELVAKVKKMLVAEAGVGRCRRGCALWLRFAVLALASAAVLGGAAWLSASGRAAPGLCWAGAAFC